MTIELKMLAWSIVLGLAYVLVAACLATQQRGIKWNAGNREGDAKPLAGVAARADRASRNFLETFPFFAAAVLAVVLTPSQYRAYGAGRADLLLGTRCLLADLRGGDSLSAHGGVDRGVLGISAGA